MNKQQIDYIIDAIEWVSINGYNYLDQYEYDEKKNLWFYQKKK